MRALFLLIIVSFLNGCLYTGVTVPLTPEEQMKASGVVATKQGTACSWSILGLVYIGDSSYGKALREGRISKVASVDKRTEGAPLFLTGRQCTVVTGN
jgi:hypothetical protein